MKVLLTTRLLMVAAVFTAWMAVSDFAQAQLYWGPYGPGNTWNSYEFVDAGRTWDAAQADAASRGGHLLTVHSWAENDMAHFLSNGGDLWLGLTDDPGRTPGAVESDNGDQTMQPNERVTGWTWITGEPLTFTDWGSGEPNDFNGAEDGAHIRGDGLWNDNDINAGIRYVVEYENNALAPPSGANLPPNLFTAPFGAGGTWNVYEMVLGNKEYWDARVRAAGDGTWANSSYGQVDTNGGGPPLPAVFSRGLDGITGGTISHLSTISGVDASVTYAGENNGGAMSRYLRDIVAVRRNSSSWIGFDDIAVEAGSNGQAYQWVDGSPVDYTNWNGGEPNDFNGAEDATELLTNGFWNDVGAGRDGGTLNQDGPEYVYVVEHDTEAEFPVEGLNRFPSLGPPPPPLLPAGRLPGNDQYLDCLWNIREVRDAGSPGDLRGAGRILASGAGRSVEGRFQFVDHRDPETNGVAGVVAGPEYPFMTDTPGVDDNDISVVAHAMITVPETGMWSFQIRSDDGSGLRFFRADGSCVNWDAAFGAGQIDPSDPCVLAFPAPTGDTDTRGSIFLEAGRHYEAEFVSYENAGGAYWEVSASKGVHSTNDGTYRLVGTKPTPQRNYFKPTMVPDGDGNNFAVQVTLSQHAMDAPHSVANARSALDNPTYDHRFGSIRGLNMKDPDAGVCCGGVDGDGIESFPSLADGVDNNNFASRSKGILEMPADGWVRLHIQSEDGFGITIQDGQFEILSAAGGPTYVTNGGQSVHADYGTGNTNTMLDVFIAAGLHDFEFVSWDGCCGAYLQAYVIDPVSGMPSSILGDATDPMDFGLSAPDTSVVSVIPEPSSFVLTGLGLLGLALGWWRRKKA